MMWRATLPKRFDSSKLAPMKKCLFHMTCAQMVFATGRALHYLAHYKSIYNNKSYKS